MKIFCICKFENNGSVFKMWVALHNKAKIFQSSDNNIVLEAAIVLCLVFQSRKTVAGENYTLGIVSPAARHSREGGLQQNVETMCAISHIPSRIRKKNIVYWRHNALPTKTNGPIRQSNCPTLNSIVPTCQCHLTNLLAIKQKKSRIEKNIANMSQTAHSILTSTGNRCVSLPYI